jgi:uncharacterized protein (TIGR03067 family)
MSFAAGDAVAVGLVSARATALTKGALHTMFVTKMKTLAALVLALTMIVGVTGVLAYHILAAEADRKEKPKPDKETIQGTWEVVSLTSDTKVSNKETMLLKNSAWVFEKDKFLITGKTEMEDVTIEGPYKLDPTKKPRTIDIIMKTPKADKKRTIEGVYKLEGDELTICIPLGRDKPRPTEFKAEEGSLRSLIVLKRKK